MTKGLWDSEAGKGQNWEVSPKQANKSKRGMAGNPKISGKIGLGTGREHNRLTDYSSQRLERKSWCTWQL